MHSTYEAQDARYLHGLELCTQTNVYRSYVKHGTDAVDAIEVFGRPDYALSEHQCIPARSTVVSLLLGDECELYKLLNWREARESQNNSFGVRLLVFVLATAFVLSGLYLVYRWSMISQSADPTSRHLYYLLFTAAIVFVFSLLVRFVLHQVHKISCRKQIKQWVQLKYTLEPETRLRLRTILSQLSFAGNKSVAEEAKIALEHVR